jgi:phage-related protein
VLGIVKAVMQALNGDWAGAWETVKQTVIGIFEGINQFFGGIPAKLLEMGRQMIAGLVQGILADGDKVVKALSGLIDQAIAGIKTLLGIKSPSTVMAGIGANMALGLIGGYSAALKPLALPGFERASGAFGGGPRVSNMRSQAKEDRSIVIHVHNEIGGKEVDNHIIRVVNGEIEGAALRYG